MKYCILGSEGQIGSVLKDVLKKEGHEVLEIDLVLGPEHDLRYDRACVVERAIMDSDFVFFLAFDVGGSHYLQKHQHTFEFLHNNIQMMVRTFEYLRKYSKPFIFASSQMSNMSYSSYGTAKAVGELYTKALNGLIVKFWNVYGVEKDLNKSHVITDFINQAKQGRIWMKTDGTEQRQFLFAEDACYALLTLAEKYDSVPREEQLHITSFEWRSILDIAELIAYYIPAEVIPATAKDTVQQDKRNEPDDFILKYWQPVTRLPEGIKKIIDTI
jgi:nucleoside-diphosphate-sugar epimerase